MADQTQEPLKLINPDVAAKYEFAFGAEQKDQVIVVPGARYRGPISGITLEAADRYVEKQKGNILRKKASPGSSAAPVVTTPVVSINDKK